MSKVELIARKFAGGASEEDVLEGYPHLTCEDVRAALRHAADMPAHEQVTLTPGAGKSGVR